MVSIDYWINIIILAIILLISIGVHEFAHAWVSYKLGDPTPKYQGRLTLNPLVHIDPIGFIMIFLIHFGWGKPVEVNPRYYKNPLLGELLVALAGPFSNLFLAFIGSLFLVIFYKFLGFGFTNTLLYLFIYQFILINAALFVFNLLPLPPLDGYRLIKFFYPKLGEWIDRNIFILTILFLVIVLAPGTGDLIKYFIVKVSSIITTFFISFWSLVFYNF